MIHNLVNHRDLKAVEDQMGFGADRTQVKKLSSGIASATQGEVVCYSPSYFRDEGFFRASKIREDRKVTHSGSNIELKPATFSSPNTDFSKNPSMDIGSMPNWGSESVTSVNFDTNSASPTPDSKEIKEKEEKMDSLAKLSSASLKEDFPDLEYVAPNETLKIELNEPKLDLANESQQANPLMGIGIVLGVAGFSYLTISTILK